LLAGGAPCPNSAPLGDVGVASQSGTNGSPVKKDQENSKPGASVERKGD
jgi:hypothetical protein